MKEFNSLGRPIQKVIITNKIDAIKELREKYHCGLKEAKDFVDHVVNRQFSENKSAIDKAIQAAFNAGINACELANFLRDRINAVESADWSGYKSYCAE